MTRNGRMGEDGMVAAMRTSSAWERYAWAAGILYVIALVAVSVVGLLGGGLSQNASAAKIANTLHDHRRRLLVIACLSVGFIAGALSRTPGPPSEMGDQNGGHLLARAARALLPNPPERQRLVSLDPSGRPLPSRRTGSSPEGARPRR